MVKKIALYIRTSRDRQTQSPAAQERSLNQLLAAKGILGKTEVYLDENVSGKKRNRPEFDKLMQDILEDKISHVVIYSYSRIARSLTHLLEFEALLRKKEIRFISVTESADTSTPTGRLIFSMLASFAQFESEIASERTINALADLKKAGKLGRPSTGLPEEKINLLKEANKSTRQIAKALNLSQSTVSRFLRRAA